MPNPIDVPVKPPSAYPNTIGPGPSQAPVGLGFNVQNAMEGAAPALGMLQADDEKTRQNSQAVQFMALLNKGVQGMQQYTQEVMQQNPQVGAEAQRNLQMLMPYLPKMNPDEARKTALNFYDGINNKLTGGKVNKMLQGGEQDMDKLIGAAELEPKDALTLKVNSDYKASQSKIAQDKLSLASVVANLRKQIADERNATTLRATRIRAVGKGLDTQGLKANVQDAAREIAIIQKSIDDAVKNDPAKAIDPETGKPVGFDEQGALTSNGNLLRENYMWNALMKDLKNQRHRQQLIINHGREKGSDEVDLREIDNTQEAGVIPPAARPTPQSSFQEIAKYLDDQDLQSDSTAVKTYMENMRKGAQKPPGVP